MTSPFTLDVDVVPTRAVALQREGRRNVVGPRDATHENVQWNVHRRESTSGSLAPTMVLLVAVCLAGCDDATTTGAGGSGATTTSSTTGSMVTTGTSSASGTTSTGTSASSSSGATGSPMFVAVGYGGRRIRSADGIQWDSDVIVDPQGGDDDNLFRGVAFIDGQFLAVGGSAKGQIATSPNGADWTFRTPGTSWLADVAPIGTTLVTAGGNGLRQRSLDGGVTWVDAAPYYAGHYRGITSGKGTAVAAGHTYGNSMVGLTTTSIDGKTWTAEITGGTPFHSVAYGDVSGGVFVAVGDDRCSTSSDGLNWKDCVGLTGAGFDRVVFVNGAFVIGNASGYFTSTDGGNFQHANAEHHGVVAYGVGVYVALDWPDKIFTSADLNTWTQRHGDGGPAFVDVAFGLVP